MERALRTPEELSFAPPRFERPVDLARHLAELPKEAACKGLFFADPIQRMRKVAPAHPLFAEGKVGSRRYVPFLNYPYADFLTLLTEAAKVVHPGVPTGEGLRRLGRAGYEALLESQVGKVLFGVFGRSFEHVVRMGARGWSVSVTFGQVRVEELGPRHVRYHFTDFPAFLETYQVGIVEGGMRACQAKGEVLVRLDSIRSGSFDIRWE